MPNANGQMLDKEWNLYVENNNVLTPLDPTKIYCNGCGYNGDDIAEDFGDGNTTIRDAAPHFACCEDYDHELPDLTFE